ncbi:unnamed protein product, partial [Chrysoparadoxa australica]
RTLATLEARESQVQALPLELRNLAIVAHVDHGKTTLVDKLLTSCSVGTGEVERVMDSIDLERERGITIMSKATRLDYGDHVLNVVDTPGHADFGGEVERVLSMVDGVLLVVDATEGPMSQTKFVLGKALAAGLKPIVVINKVDRPSARLNGEVENELFDLFVSLGASDDQLEYPTLYASAKVGWVTECPEEALVFAERGETLKMASLLDTIVSYIPPPFDGSALDMPFALAVNNIGTDPYLGTLTTGKIEGGTVGVGQAVKVLSRDGNCSGESHKVAQIFVSRGMEKVPLEGFAGAGLCDIVTLAGPPGWVGDTITDFEEGLDTPLVTPPLAPPTLAMTFAANDGPLCGHDGGTSLTASAIKRRLLKETENNVTISVTKCPTDSEKLDVHGRGELQLGILIENMRREGFEFCVSPPRIVYQRDERGQKLEPVEEVTVDVDAEYSGVVMDRLSSAREGELIEMKESGVGKTRMVFTVPTRSLLGFGSEIKQETRGSAVVNSIFSHMRPAAAEGPGLSPGKLVCCGAGKATSYALNQIQERGKLFIKAGDEVYDGMVFGENAKPGDLEINPTKVRKKLTNMRTSNADEAIRVSPPVVMSPEELIAYMGQDEMLEVTPLNIRLRKAALDQGERQRLGKAKRAAKGK